MSFPELSSALERNAESRIIDTSLAVDISYDHFAKNAASIAKDLIRMKLPEKSIVVIYKFEFPIDIACVWVACTNVDLIPYIIENDSLPSASDINYKAVISTSLSVSIEGTESSTLSDKFYIHIKKDGSFFTGNGDSLLIVTSSKTTSNIAKKILLGRKGTIANIQSNITPVGIRKEDVTLIVLPMEYSYGLIAQFLSHIFVGSTIVFAPKIIGVIHISALIEKYSVSSIFLTPLLARLMMLYNKDRIESLSLKYVTLGGDKAIPEDIPRLRSIFNCRIIGTYGFAEVGPRVATKEIVEDENEYDLGNSNDGVYIDIENSPIYSKLTGKEDIGFLKVKTPSLFLGYINGNILNKKNKTIFITKDVTYRENGKYHNLGRDGDYLLLKSKLIWFIEIKRELFKDIHITKVGIRKIENRLKMSIYVRGLKDYKPDIENTLSKCFSLSPEKDYIYELLDFQSQTYK